MIYVISTTGLFFQSQVITLQYGLYAGVCIAIRR